MRTNSIRFTFKPELFLVVKNEARTSEYLTLKQKKRKCCNFNPKFHAHVRVGVKVEFD
jgi:hypothetical protein